MCGDPRLGPQLLPRRLPLLSFVSDYDRFGGQTPGEFLKKWTFPSNGTYRYPPFDGFQLDTAGKPIRGNLTLRVGTELDRFGSEFGTYHSGSCVPRAKSTTTLRTEPLTDCSECAGSFVSAADAPYDQRSLSPTNLDTNPTASDYPYNYHVYKVVKEFDVLGGPIAPWFGQPGLGAQFYVGYIGNIMKLIELEYVQKINKTIIKRGPGTPNPCG